MERQLIAKAIGAAETGKAVRLSFIVPAHNEETCLGATLQAIHESAGAVGQPYEIVVANDASTDATAEIALKNGARVVHVTCRQIAGARNAGARAATGERFVFVDADTIINPRVRTSALPCMRRMPDPDGHPSPKGCDSSAQGIRPG